VKSDFSRFLEAAPGRLHASAHSHHPWPDVTWAAHQQAWEDAARYMDDKWDHVLGAVIPEAKAQVASVLGLTGAESLVFAPNTHEFIGRIASTLAHPFSVLTTDSEFHSFARQLARWEEAGVATASRVAAEPFDTFPERFVTAFDGHDLVFVSQVHFNSGYVVPDLASLVGALPESPTIVIDGYHGFMALPTNLARVADRAFYLAGGYKYAMAGEGACFLHVPPSAALRPVDTGWWAGFGALTENRHDVPYSSGGQRFAGATADPSGIYRLSAVLKWLGDRGVGVADIHRHVGRLQQQLLDALDPGLMASLIPGSDAPDRGHFLTFRRPDAGEIYRRLHAAGVITDFRADRWRIGLGIYHDAGDVELLAGLINAVLDED
jgi:selenocysteine lyase/cysteine desulfurase